MAARRWQVTALRLRELRGRLAPHPKRIQSTMHFKGHPRERHRGRSPQDRVDYACAMFEMATQVRIEAIQGERKCTREEALERFREEWNWHNRRKVERWATSLKGSR